TGKPMFLQAAVAYDETDDAAAQAAYERWGVAALEVSETQDIATPREFDQRVAQAHAKTVRDRLRVSASVEQHAAWLSDDFSLGFYAVSLHHVGRDAERFINVFARQVLPQAQRAAGQLE